MEKYLQKTNDSNTDIVEEIVSSETDEEDPPLKKTRKSVSEVWSYFKKTDKQYAKCRICGKMYKTSGNTSNLFDHLKRAHPSYQELPKPSVTIDSFFKRNECYQSGSEHKENLDKALMTMIATDVQPFSIVEDKGFRDFVRALDPRYKLPSRTTLQNVMAVNLYSSIKYSLKTVLNEIEQCAITMDGWTSRANEGYLTVTCHFITSEYTLRSAVLSTKKLLTTTNHNAENIATSLRAVLDEWDIYSKVATIVTDNDSTMLKACELLQKRHLPCFAHTVNLVVQDSLSQDYIKNVLVKCKRIVTFFKSSTISYEKFKADQDVEKPYSLIQEVPTRWNSALRMIERILITHNSISRILLLTSKAPPTLTADEIELLQDLKDLLIPFDNATVQTSSNTYVTVSLIIPLIYGIFESLNESKIKMRTSEGFRVCMFLLERVKKRLFSYEERTATRLATLLDPRFKKEGFQFASNAEKASHLLQNEIGSIPKVIPLHNDVEEPSTSNSTQQNMQPQLFNFIKNKIANKIRTSQVDAIISLRQYFEYKNMDIGSDPLQFWKGSAENMSLLKSCATRYLCIPATSTESERVFSKAGHIISERRTCLKPKNVDQLLFINKNYWLNQ